jgi:hypothetical protein
MPDTIPWAVPYVAGNPAPLRQYPKPGNYTLKGLASGHASVSLLENASKTHLHTVSVRYHAFSNDGRSFLHGTQSVTEDVERLTLDKLEWYSNLTWTGEYEGSQVTSPDGFRMSIDALENLFEANGTLKTVVGGIEYGQPGNGQWCEKLDHDLVVLLIHVQSMLLIFSLVPVMYGSAGSLVVSIFCFLFRALGLSLV